MPLGSVKFFPQRVEVGAAADEVVLGCAEVLAGRVELDGSDVLDVDGKLVAAGDWEAEVYASSEDDDVRVQEDLEVELYPAP